MEAAAASNILGNGDVSATEVLSGIERWVCFQVFDMIWSNSLSIPLAASQRTRGPQLNVRKRCKNTQQA